MLQAVSRLEATLVEADAAGERSALRVAEVLEERFAHALEDAADKLEERLGPDLESIRQQAENAIVSAARAAAATEQLGREIARGQVLRADEDISLLVERALARLEARAAEAEFKIEAKGVEVDRVLERTELAVRQASAQIERRRDEAVDAVGVLAAEFDGRLDRRLDDSDRLARATAERLDEVSVRIDGALAAIAESERRMLGGERRIARAERTAVTAVEAVERMHEIEQRLYAAASVEAEAARRVHEAERRLAEHTRLDPLGE